MDFNPSPRVEELRARIRNFLDEHVYPVEMEALRALDDEVKPGVAYPEILVEIRERMAALGGTLRLVPRLERGTEFVVEIPLEAPTWA